uniref:RHS repeat domain-containing protein n=1 Tax=Segatella maculosa TaxID=439703 RepID=UPI00035F99C2
EGWVQHPKRNTTPGTPPGPPIQWGAPEDPDNAQPGYGYIPTDTTNTEDIFFYHSDHLGSTSYITDAKANITQFDAYLPYGELLVDEHSSSEDMPYKFNGKEMDAETGLYYYGARYMNPVTSLWYGVDALIEAKPSMAGNTYCLGNPINLTDPDGNWEWNKNGNLVAQKGDQATSLAKFLGTNIKNAMTILHRVGVKANKRDILNLKAGQVLNKKDLWVGFKAASGKVVHNTEEATRHYLHGHGESADVGDQSTLELLTSSKFREKHTKITSQVVAPQGYFSVDMTKKTFHIGNTNIDYSISNNGKSASVTYTLFARDGFWDPDFIDEKGLGKIPVINKLTHTIPDGMGPNLERFGGTPYHYKTRTRTYFFKPVQ